MTKQDKFEVAKALEDKKQNAVKNSIFDDADLILEENIFENSNSQEQMFTNANEDDKQAVVQILEQVEVSVGADDTAENKDAIEPENDDNIAQEIEDVLDIAEGETKSDEQNETQEKQPVEQQDTAKPEERKYGKFKNPDELLHAYGELEKEFTRRSQRLKELENANANPFANNDDFKAAVDKFFKETPSAKAFAKDIANEIIEHPELKQNKNCLDIALTRTLLKRFRTPEQLIEDGQFLKDYVYGSKKIKDAIIGEYLQSVRDGEPPFTLGGGGRQFAVSPKHPKTIEEAGFMFLKENK